MGRGSQLSDAVKHSTRLFFPPSSALLSCRMIPLRGGGGGCCTLQQGGNGEGVNAVRVLFRVPGRELGAV